MTLRASQTVRGTWDVLSRYGVISKLTLVCAGVGYPGGKYFDPFGFSRGNEAKLQEYKVPVCVSFVLFH